ncbi:MAG: putative cytokinetic ring protein SteA, partial [Candidatus Zipacnadales bacterium]
LFDRLENGQMVTICRGRVLVGDEDIGSCRQIGLEEVHAKSEAAGEKIQRLLLDFATNTLEFIRSEPQIVWPSEQLPELRTPIRGRPVVVVARGQGTRDDLHTIRAYIEDVRPVLIGVDGGADILMAEGLRPDLIVGDLDSAGTETLHCGAEVLVHAYADGRSPGVTRAEQLGLDYQLLRLPGTSEDAALALAFDKGADLIVIVGSHTNLPDFLEKGRHGMASTFLTRLKVGDRLVDAKGVSKLYQGSIRLKHVAYIAGAAALAACGILLVSPFVRGVLRFAGIQMILALRDLWQGLFG